MRRLDPEKLTSPPRARGTVPGDTSDGSIVESAVDSGGRATFSIKFPAGQGRLASERMVVLRPLQAERGFSDSNGRKVSLGSEVSYVAESLPAGGIRFAAVINGKPKGGKVELKFAVEGTPDGMRLIPLPDGGILIGNDDESVLVLGAPWAVSADGTLIKTRYEIRGSTISQIVEVTDTTVYPVVADPSAWFSSSNCGIGTCTKYWYVRDTLWLSQCCTGTVAAFQMVIGALSWAGGPWAGIPVTSLMGVQYANFSNQLWSAVNNTNAGNPRCLFFKYLIPGGGVTGWWGHVSYYSNNNCWWST